MSYTKCISRLIQAAGRNLTDEEVQAVFERVHKAALDIKAGRASPADIELGKKLSADLGVDKSADTIVQEAAARAAAELEHEAMQRERQAQLQITKIAARLGDYETIKQSGYDDLESLKNVITRNYKGNVNVESLEQRAEGHHANFMRKLIPAWDALGNDWLGFFQDRQKLLTLIRELRGEDTGDALAKKGAKAFHDTAEEARQVFNEAGGDIGKLDDWGMPQHHSQEKVARAAEILGKGKVDDPEVNRQAWVDYMTPKLLGNEKYVDDFGQPWTETRMREFLSKAWDTISTNGIANMEPGEYMGVGKRANRNAEHRQIHFKNASDVIEYWNTFGDKSAVEILMGHIDKMAKDIAFIEHFGPNPDLTYKTLRDQAVKTAISENPKEATSLKGRTVKLDALYNYVSGKITPSANVTFSNIADTIANLNIAGKLGGASVASFFGDKPIYEAVSHLNDIPIIQRWQSELSMLNPKNGGDRRLLQRQGLMLEGVRSGLNRFYESGLGSPATTSGKIKTTTGKLANAVMRLTGMSAINDIRKGTFGLNLFSSIGHEISKGKSFADLADSDVRTLKNYGITEADWNTWRLADLEEIKVGSTSVKNALTPESISQIPEQKLLDAGIISDISQAAKAKRDAMVKLLGAVNTESDFAIVTPGWRERAQFYAGMAGNRGTVSGEIARSVLQFKSFPWAYLQRGMDLVANADRPTSKAVMTAYIIASTTLAGAMLLQTREMLAGKDPRKMFDDKDWYKFWGQAFVQGGALGIYGDFLYGVNQTRYGSGPVETLAGPTLGPLMELTLVQPLNAAAKHIEGKETHLGAQTFQDVKSWVPGGNMWYAKAALDHLVWQQIMESLSPGYMANIRSRTLKDYHQQWWWEPGELSPKRAPDIKKAVEQ